MMKQPVEMENRMNSFVGISFVLYYPQTWKPKQRKFVKLEVLPSRGTQMKRFVRLLQPWFQWPPPWMLTTVSLDQSPLPLETTIGHHNAFEMYGINQ